MVNKKSENITDTFSRSSEHSTRVQESSALLGSRQAENIRGEISVTARPSKKTN